MTFILPLPGQLVTFFLFLDIYNSDLRRQITEEYVVERDEDPTYPRSVVHADCDNSDW